MSFCEVADPQEVVSLVAAVHGTEERICEYATCALVSSSARFSVGVRDNCGLLVSWLCVMPTPLSLDGVHVPAAQMGIVGTLPSHRQKGLCRVACAGFDAAAKTHLGALLHVIAGIPHFYRNVGYEYVAELRWFLDVLPPVLKSLSAAADSSTVVVREAATDAELAEYAEVRNSKWGSLAKVRTADVDVATLSRQRGFYTLRETCFCAQFFTLKSALDGSLQASFALNSEFGRCVVNELWIAPGADVHACTSAAIACAADRGGPGLVPAVRRPLQAHVESAVLELCHETRGWPRPYAWYCKIPDLAALLDALRPALTRRLAAAGNTADAVLVLHSFKPGHSAKLVVEHGAVVRAEHATEEEGDPNNVVLMFSSTPPREPGQPEVVGLCPAAACSLVLGRRTVDELQDVWPETVMTPGAAALCRILFPRLETDISLAF